METPAAPSNLVICLGCAQPNPEGVHFCSGCGAPLTSYATTAPFEGTLARGYAYRQAVTGRPRLIVLAGVWLTMFPAALVGFFLVLGSLLMLAAAISHREAAMIIGGLFASGGSFVVFWISAGIVIRVTWNFFAREPGPQTSGRSESAGGVPESAAAPGRDEETMTCLACGAPIAEGREACDSCGWSYESEPVEPAPVG